MIMPSMVHATQAEKRYAIDTSGGRRISINGALTGHQNTIPITIRDNSSAVWTDSLCNAKLYSAGMCHIHIAPTPKNHPRRGHPVARPSLPSGKQIKTILATPEGMQASK